MFLLGSMRAANPAKPPTADISQVDNATLKLASAFATLGVIDHEVVGVAIEPVTYGVEGEVKVVVSTDSHIQNAVVVDNTSAQDRNVKSTSEHAPYLRPVMPSPAFKKYAIKYRNVCGTNEDLLDTYINDLLYAYDTDSGPSLRNAEDLIKQSAGLKADSLLDEECLNRAHNSFKQLRDKRADSLAKAEKALKVVRLVGLIDADAVVYAESVFKGVCSATVTYLNKAKGFLKALRIVRAARFVDAELKTLLKKSRKEPTLSHHLHMLNLLILPELEGPLSKQQMLARLAQYITIMSHRKMARRACHPRSKPFLDVLCNVNGRDIVKFLELEPRRQDKQEGSERQRKQRLTDRACLKRFLSMLRDISHPTFNDYPILTELAAGNEDAPSLYNAKTCQEFHTALTFVVTSFHKDLHNLLFNLKVDQLKFPDLVSQVVWAGLWLQRLSRGAALRMHLHVLESILPPPQQPNKAHNSNLLVNDTLYNDTLSTAAEHHSLDGFAGVGDGPSLDPSYKVQQQTHNSTLQAVIDSAFRVADEVNDGAVLTSVASDVAKASSEDIELATEEADNEEFEDLATIRPGAFMEWIRLITVQFSAAELLVFNARRFPQLSIQTLVVSPTKSDMESWEKLVGSAWFPKGYLSFDNKDLIVAMRKAQQSNHKTTLGLVNDIKTNWEKALSAYKHSQPCSESFTQAANFVVGLLEQTNVPRCRGYAVDIFAAMGNPTTALPGVKSENPGTSDTILANASSSVMAAGNLNPGNVTESYAVQVLANKATCNKIGHYLDSIEYTCRVFRQFSRNASSLEFAGSLHCEACLASLISTPVDSSDEKFTSILRTMKSYGRVIGVSKLCCPLCGHLLSSIGAGQSADSKPQAFLTRGTHTTPYSCTLPDWLPSVNVIEMIKVFAPAFREELVNLLQPERGHRHTSLTESASSLTLVSLSVSNASDFEDEGDRDPKLPFGWTTDVL